MLQILLQKKYCDNMKCTILNRRGYPSPSPLSPPVKAKEKSKAEIEAITAPKKEIVLQAKGILML